MRSEFLTIIKKYRGAMSSPFGGNSIADFIRKDLSINVLRSIGNDSKYLVKASPGNGNWAACPWVAIFNTSITKSAQDGYYPVFIFRHDMSGLYLTLNQGVTSVGVKFKKEAKKILKENAYYFRKEIGDIPSNFEEIIIDLKVDGLKRNSLPKNYEAGNVIAKFYDAENLPNDEIFIEDIRQMLIIYDSLALNYGISKLLEEDKEQEKIEAESIPQTEKEQLIKARLGQGIFKTKLSKIEKGCRVTGVNNPVLLTASHIKPWCKSEHHEKIDGNNGLLLSPHVDRLFDRGLISFTDDGDILVKESIKNEIAIWGLSKKNVGSFNNKQRVYLAYHRHRYNFDVKAV